MQRKNPPKRGGSGAPFAQDMQDFTDPVDPLNYAAERFP